MPKSQEVLLNCTCNGKLVHLLYERQSFWVDKTRDRDGFRMTHRGVTVRIGAMSFRANHYRRSIVITDNRDDSRLSFVEMAQEIERMTDKDTALEIVSLLLETLG